MTAGIDSLARGASSSELKAMVSAARGELLQHPHAVAPGEHGALGAQVAAWIGAYARFKSARPHQNTHRRDYMKAMFYWLTVAAAFMFGEAVGMGCSVPDPGDEAEMERMVGTLPPSQLDPLVVMTMNTAASEWLGKRPGNDQVMFTECREISPTVGPWRPTGSFSVTVFDMLGCLLTRIDATYASCAKMLGDKAADRALQTRTILFDLNMQAITEYECKSTFDFRYKPERLPAEATDPKAVDTKDVVRAIIRAPVPPPGFLVPGGWLPVLCPLGAGPGWGCPPRPGDIGAGNGAAGSGDFQ